jgi:caa(3)-type oxidase subunit IV
MSSSETPTDKTAGHDRPVHDAKGHLVHDPVAEDHGHAHAHVHPESHYYRIYVYLLGLFFISVLGPVVGTWTGFWWLTLITAFGIAIVKATLVIKHFMHLDVEQPFVHYFLATALVFMFLFFAGVAPDVMNHHGTGWVNKAAKAETARVLALPGPHGHDGGGAAHAPAGAAHGEAAGHAAEPAPAH